MENFKLIVAGINELFNFQVVNNGADNGEYDVFAGNKLVKTNTFYANSCGLPGLLLID